MSSPYFTDGTVSLHLGKALDVLPEIANESVDAVVCDPPYALTNLHPNVVIDALTRWLAGDRAYIPSGRGGFMNAAWDEFVPPPAAWDECLRVLKPGGHLLAFAAPRTQDLMGMSIRIAGFEIRDSIDWIFGNGFPKGQDIAKSIDRHRDDRNEVLQVTAWLAAARDEAGWTNKRIDALFGTSGMAGLWTTQGVAAIVPQMQQWIAIREAIGFDDAAILPLVTKLNSRKGGVGEAFDQREVVGSHAAAKRKSDHLYGAYSGDGRITIPATDAARRWDGWNTSLKPAHEPIIIARKSTGFNTVVANVLQHGTGAINIDACRVKGVADNARANKGGYLGYRGGGRPNLPYTGSDGRWPTNVLFSHSPACDDTCVPSCPAANLDAQTGTLTSGTMAAGTRRTNRSGYTGAMPAARGSATHGDSGGGSRFFPVFRYEPKAPASERPRLDNGTAHATVKPLQLMRWLVRLVTPPGGTVLDPFAGSGTTLEACVIEGFHGIGIEQHQPYADLCVKRLSKPIQSVLGFEEAP